MTACFGYDMTSTAWCTAVARRHAKRPGGSGDTRSCRATTRLLTSARFDVVIGKPHLIVNYSRVDL
jgi:hypothetical protein